MSPDLYFVLALLLKMAVAAGFVVAASLIAERSGPVIGALVATLPLSAGPGYAFLALDHDASYIAASALASHVVNGATCVYAIVYAMLAQRHSVMVALPCALLTWIGLAAIVQSVPWTATSGVLLNIGVLSVCQLLARRYTGGKMPAAFRRWYDIPLRAGLVACLVAALVTLSKTMGPTMTGIIPVFPIILSSLILILQPRIGGPAAASVIANSVAGLFGFGIATLFLHFAAEPLGKWLALALAFGITVAWNFALWLVWRSGWGARIALLFNRSAMF